MLGLLFWVSFIVTSFTEQGVHYLLMSLVHFLALCLLVVALLSPAEAMRPLRQKLPSDRNRNAWAHLQGAPPEDVKSAILAEVSIVLNFL